MPFYDYTSKKNTNPNEFKRKPDNLENIPNERLLNQNAQQFINPLPPINQPFIQQTANVQRTASLNNQSINPPVQYRFVSPPIQQPAILPTPIKAKVDTRSIFVATDDVQTSNKGIQIEKDLIKMATKSVNTELKLDQVRVKNEKPKLNFINEGFRTYYDDQADVLGVMCFLCWANCCQNCNNICRGCRNNISCPVYCWILFIIPIFILFLTGILVAAFYGLSVNILRPAILGES